MEFPKSWPVPDSVPRPITARVWLEEGAKILEKGEMVPGHLASANLIAARVTGTDPKVIAAVIRGALMNSLPAEALQRVDIPVLILNGRQMLPTKKSPGFTAMPTARAGECEGDHNSTPYQPTFQQAVVQFFQGQWRLRYGFDANNNRYPSIWASYQLPTRFRVCHRQVGSYKAPIPALYAPAICDRCH